MCLDPQILFLPLQPHPCGKAAFEKAGVRMMSNWKRRLKLICSRFKKLQESRATGHLAGGANAPYERFAAGKTSAQAEFTSAEHLNHRRVKRVRFGSEEQQNERAMSFVMK